MMSEEVSRVLDLHCLHHGTDRSAVLSNFILKYCDRFVMYPGRGKASAEGGESADVA